MLMTAKEILGSILKAKEVKVVSFDIFDTLIFRNARKSTDVFSYMYERNREYFPEYTEQEDWVNLRKHVEGKKRRENKVKFDYSEVTIEEIYSGLPETYDSKTLMNIEYEEEKKTCFLNKEIAGLIEYIHLELRLEIILVSDMYWGKDKICELLDYCGMDMSYVEDVFVSSDYKASKRIGNLYNVVLEKEKLLAHQMFHIGDNYYSDVGVPKHMGINACLYDLISGSFYRYPFLSIEHNRYGDICREIHTLRILAAEANDDFWFKLGAMIYGPLLVLAIEWVLDVAKKDRIKRIRPLMREGYFLTELLKNSATYHGLKIDIAPLYSSRYAVFAAKFENITRKDLAYLMQTNNITLYEILNNLHIIDLFTKYSNYMEKTVPELRRIIKGDGSVWQEIYELIINDEMIQKIRELNKGSSERLVKYLVQSGFEEDTITLDVGWYASTQSAIDDVLRNAGINSKRIHLLVVGKPGAVSNISDNHDIRGFIGNFGADSKSIWSNFPRIFELFSMCNQGTTVGYEIKNGMVEPVKKEVIYAEYQIKAIEKVQEGVFEFQKHFLENEENYRCCYSKRADRIQLHKLIERLCAAPLHSEALKIKELSYDQNFGANAFCDIIDDSVIKEFVTVGRETFFAHPSPVAVAWNSGMNSIIDPFFHCKNFLYENQQYMALAFLHLTNKACNYALKNNYKVVLACAGRNLPVFISYFAMADCMELIEAIVDNDVNLQGIDFYSIQIKPVDEIFDSVIYLCTTSNSSFEASIFNQITTLNTGNDKYISYFREYNIDK